MIYMRTLPIVTGICFLLLMGCSSEQQNANQSAESPETSVQSQADQSLGGVAEINQLISKDQYEQALKQLEEATQMADTTRRRLREKTHLNYGLFLEYRGGDRSMRDRMTNALRQFIEVLHINRENQKALTEIKQIMGIYGTMPEKSPPADIKKELNALGIRY